MEIRVGTVTGGELVKCMCIVHFTLSVFLSRNESGSVQVSRNLSRQRSPDTEGFAVPTTTGSRIPYVSRREREEAVTDPFVPVSVRVA